MPYKIHNNERFIYYLASWAIALRASTAALSPSSPAIAEMTTLCYGGKREEEEGEG